MLVQYVRNESGVKTGCVVALDRNHIGWSKCHPNKDKFSKKKALSIAVGRANKPDREMYNCHIHDVDLHDTIAQMEDRAKRYFK